MSAPGGRFAPVPPRVTKPQCPSQAVALQPPRACPRPSRERGPTRVGAAAGVSAGDNGSHVAAGEGSGATARGVLPGPSGSTVGTEGHGRLRGAGRGQPSCSSSCPRGQAGTRQSRDSICAKPQRDELRGCQADARDAVWWLVTRFARRPVAPLMPARGSDVSLRGSRCQAGQRHCPLAGRMPSMSRGEQDCLPPWRSDRGTRPPRRRWQLIRTASRSPCCELG